jgi:predicted membrane-bound spermidine synthase
MRLTQGFLNQSSFKSKNFSKITFFEVLNSKTLHADLFYFNLSDRPLRTKFNSKYSLYLLIAFIEGGAVMSTEIIGAKLPAPFFGSSLSVWTAILAITLFGLTAGYFAGGFLSERKNNQNLLNYLLLSASLFIAVMPFTARFALNTFQFLDLIPAVILSTLFFLLPPMFFLGTISPMIIKEVSLLGNNPGKSAGTVLAISTIGGILFLMITGFYIIGQIGLTLSCILIAAVLSVIPLFRLIRNKIFAVPLLVFAFISLLGARAFVPPAMGNVKLLYQKEGVMGQVTVIDADNIVFEGRNRALLVNRVIQTLEAESGEVLPYINLVQQITSRQSFGNALLLGLGGGTLANVLYEQTVSLDAVEFDPRIAEVSKTFFDLNSGVNVFVDDARRYLNKNDQKYDLIVFDLFRGEEAPEHVITIESLNRLKFFLPTDGLIIINTHGFIDTDKGIGNLSIVKTLHAAGFQTKIIATNEYPEARNIEIIGFRNEFSLSGIQGVEINIKEEELKKAQVLTDEKPVLNYLNRKAAKSWRKGYLNYLIKELDNRNLPVFS